MPTWPPSTSTMSAGRAPAVANAVDDAAGTMWSRVAQTTRTGVSTSARETSCQGRGMAPPRSMTSWMKLAKKLANWARVTLPAGL